MLHHTHTNQFSEAFQTSTGFTQIGMTLFLAIKSYHRKGGTIDEMHRIVERALGEEVWTPAMKDAGWGTQANTSGGTTAEVSQDRSGFVPPARTQPANNGPSASVMAGMRAAAQGAAEAIFDTFKTRDGRFIGDVRYGELERLASQDQIEGAVFEAIRKRGVAAHDTKVRHLIKPAMLETIIRNAQRKHAA